MIAGRSTLSFEGTMMQVDYTICEGYCNITHAAWETGDQVSPEHYEKFQIEERILAGLRLVMESL